MNRTRLLVRLGGAAFIAAMLAGPGAAVFPSTLSWGAWAACPGGTTPAPERFRASYSHPGETQVRFLCVAPDGSGEDHTGMAMVGLWAMYFVAGTVLLSLLGLRAGTRTVTSASAAAPRRVPSKVVEAARKLHWSGQTISAIKLVREASGMGLKEAKDWVVALPQHPPSFPADAFPTAPSPGADAPANRLVQLEHLLDAGLITADEFAAKRAAILPEL
jgi:hypothetical protein